MIGDFAGRFVNDLSLGSNVTKTSGCSKPGRYLEIGSSSAIAPFSTSIMTATEVTGLVIDAILKIESTPTGAWFATSRLPNAPL